MSLRGVAIARAKAQELTERPSRLRTLRWVRPLGRWLAKPERASALWLSKQSVVVAWVGLFIAALCPPHGFGSTICWFSNATGLPCPGCGVTRSLSCGLRGLWLESWHYHPLGLFILALFFLTALQSVLPRAARQDVARRIQDHALVFNTTYLIFVVGFTGYGFARAISQFTAQYLMP